MLSKLHEEVQREFEIKKRNNIIEQDRRTKEIQDKFPDILDIDEKFRRLYPRLTVLVASGNEKEATEIKNIIKELLEEKRKLLTAKNIKVDYVKNVYSCQLCKDTGLLDIGKRCECYFNSLSKKILEMFKITDKLKEESFETFSEEFYSEDMDQNTGISPRNVIQMNLNKIHKALENPNDLKSMYIYGDTGVGKTFLLNCIANEVLKMNKSIIYLPAQELLSIINDYKFNNKAHEFANQEFYKFLCDCDMLLIDDLGTESNTSVSSAEFFYLLDLRIRTRKATVITSNLKLEELEDSYTQRISSRIIGDFLLLKMLGNNIRILKKYGQNV